MVDFNKTWWEDGEQSKEKPSKTLVNCHSESELDETASMFDLVMHIHIMVVAAQRMEVWKNLNGDILSD